MLEILPKHRLGGDEEIIELGDLYESPTLGEWNGCGVSVGIVKKVSGCKSYRVIRREIIDEFEDEIEPTPGVVVLSKVAGYRMLGDEEIVEFGDQCMNRSEYDRRENITRFYDRAEMSIGRPANDNERVYFFRRID